MVRLLSEIRVYECHFLLPFWIFQRSFHSKKKIRELVV